MNRKRIKYLLALRGITQQKIADMVGVSAPNVAAVISGDRQTPHIQGAIAEAIDRPISQIFPRKKKAKQKKEIKDVCNGKK